MKLPFITALLLVVSVPLTAQRAPANHDSNLFAMSAAVVSTAVLSDIASTLLVIHVCEVCRETNPLAAPFINAGPVPAVLVASALTGATLALTNLLRKHDQSGKHFWLAVPILLTLGHVLAVDQNLGHAFGPYSSLR